MHIATGGIVGAVPVREWPKGRDNRDAYTGHTSIIGAGYHAYQCRIIPKGMTGYDTNHGHDNSSWRAEHLFGRCSNLIV